jgi:hypothetical protein
MNHFKAYLAVLILLHLIFQQPVMAHPIQRHVVGVGELDSQLINQSAQRVENIQEIQKLLRQNPVQQQLGNLFNLEKVELAVAALDDETLNKLAAESQKVNDEIEAGMATWGWVVIAAIAAFVIIVIVAASTID